MRKLLLAPFIIASTAFMHSSGPEKAVPEKKESKYLIKVANQSMEIDPMNGGRIASITVDGAEIFTTRYINQTNWGSTFWTSPQSSWGWPPVEEIDSKPYAAVVEENTLKMTAARDSKLGVVITKEIYGNKKDTSYLVRYTITNTTEKAIKIAPWEITRVHPDGLTFYPTGKGEKRGDLAKLTFDKNGITWYDYDHTTIPGGVPKLLADGSEGWLGHLHGHILLLKKFVDVPVEKQAPDEGEIELYANPDRTYIEIEQQGIYEEIQPKASKSWDVKWIIRRLPASVKAEAGNQELVNYVRKFTK
jgi:hypothetical protein